MKPEADLVIVTATEVESRAVLSNFLPDADQIPDPEPFGDLTYFNLGTIHNARIFLIQCPTMGSSSLGSSLQTVTKAIETLSPSMVIMIGIAFGLNKEKQAIGDILVSEQLRPYDLQRVGTLNGQQKIILRDDKPRGSTRLVSLFRGSIIPWKGAKVRIGVILTGNKLVDNQDFTDQLIGFEPEAIGGEMEGAGLYAACHDKKIDWILVKGICDWADGNKGENTDANQILAAENAAAFVFHSLKFTKEWWKSSLQGGSGNITAMLLIVTAPLAIRAIFQSLVSPLFTTICLFLVLYVLQKKLIPFFSRSDQKILDFVRAKGGKITNVLLSRKIPVISSANKSRWFGIMIETGLLTSFLMLYLSSFNILVQTAVAVPNIPDINEKARLEIFNQTLISLSGLLQIVFWIEVCCTYGFWKGITKQYWSFVSIFSGLLGSITIWSITYYFANGGSHGMMNRMAELLRAGNAGVTTLLMSFDSTFKLALFLFLLDTSVTLICTIAICIMCLIGIVSRWLIEKCTEIVIRILSKVLNLITPSLGGFNTSP